MSNEFVALSPESRVDSFAKLSPEESQEYHTYLAERDFLLDIQAGIFPVAAMEASAFAFGMTV